jgi:hypothetical protein
VQRSRNVRVISSVITVIVLSNIALASGAMYLLPALIGSIRRVPDAGTVVAINVLLGWTLIGWAIALAMALRSARQPGAVVQIVQNLPAAPPPSLAPTPSAGQDWAGRPGPYPFRDGSPPPLVLPPQPAGPGTGG